MLIDILNRNVLDRNNINTYNINMNQQLWEEIHNNGCYQIARLEKQWTHNTGCDIGIQPENK